MNQQQLKSILRYEPDSGLFYVVKSTAPRVKVGSVAGSKNASGYIVINRSRVYMAHRLAWLYMTGEFPVGQIDHIDCDRSNTKWDNLRLATRTENRRNASRSRNNTTGFKGVSRARSKYRATISVDYKQICLGNFDTAEEAHEAYKKAAADLYGEFARAA